MIERYLAIAFSLKLQGWNLLHKTKIAVILYLIISFAMPVHALLFLEAVNFGPPFGYFCIQTQDETNRETYRIMDIIIMRVLHSGICGVVILIFSILIARNLFQARRQRLEMSKTEKKETGPDKETQITIMLISISMVYLISKIPYFITRYIYLYGIGKENVPSTIKINKDVFGWFAEANPIAGALTEINFMINFILYMIFLKQFRWGFFGLFGCKWKSDSKGSTSGSVYTVSTTKGGASTQG